MTLPWGRGLLALLETCQSQRWRKWLITAKDCLIVDGEPVLWLVPNWKACTAAYWWLSFPRVMDFSSASRAAGLQFSCGGGLQWLMDLDFSGSRATRGYAVIDFQHQLPITGWMGLMVLQRKPIQSELKIDIKGPSIPRHFGVHERRQRTCVLEEIQYSNHQYLSLKISTYPMQEEETKFLYLLVAYNQASSAGKYLKKRSLLKI